MTTSATGDDPGPFDSRPYPEAKAAADREGRWFLVIAMAGWHGPAQQLKEAMCSVVITQWLSKMAITVAVDIEASPEAEELGVEAVPTAILFKNGCELGRVVGFQSAPVWLAKLERLLRPPGAASTQADHDKTPAAAAIEARYRAAERLIEDRRYQEATAEFVWLWEHMCEQSPSMCGVRTSFMAGKMKKLAGLSPEANERFKALRDAIWRASEEVPVRRDEIHDWIVLNEVIGDQAATLAWFERVKEDRHWREVLRSESRRIEPLFRRDGRWRDAGRLMADPVQDLEREIELLNASKAVESMMPRDSIQRMQEFGARRLRQTSAWMCACLLAAGRDADADLLVARARREDPDDKMLEAIVREALDAGQPRAAHVQWLQTVKNGRLDWLKRDVEAALKK